CRDVTVQGENYLTQDPRLPDRKTFVLTGAFSPFGVPTRKGQVISGKIPCSGAILKIPLDGGKPELVAWGFRNPFGLAFSPDGGLYVTENSYDDRGSRPVHGTGDPLWKVTPGAWYGWPDFHGKEPLDLGDHHVPPGKERPKRLLAAHPNDPPEPVALLGVHSSSNGFDFSRNRQFGYEGQAFIAQFGDQAPVVGKVLSPVGFKVVRVDVATGVIHDFAVNRGKTNGPASRIGGGGLERPVAARFDPTGTALYVVDFGVMTMDRKGSDPRKGTGILWRITRTEGTAP
ncbi:MAG: glucose dehydrogenase, partial [Candidatus Manganitrophaceae bacterium]